MNITHNIVTRIQVKDFDDLYIKTNEDDDALFDIECGCGSITLPKSIISLLKSALDKQTEKAY